MGKGIIEVFILYWPIFLRGLFGTLWIALVAVFGGSVIGALVSMCTISKNKVLKTIATVYVTVLRGTPLLVQMYISYYFIPMAIPALNRIDVIYFVLLALILNSSAYVSEIIRGGIQAVDKGQSEAALSLGMSEKNCMIKIIMPQAIKNILPALAGEYIAMVKETSLAGTFMVYELMYTRTLLANKYLSWQPLFIIAAIYLLVTLTLTWAVKKLEKRLSVSD